MYWVQSPVSVSDTTTNFYFKLPYIGPFSVVTQKKGSPICYRYCNSIDIKLIFSSFNIGTMFGVKDAVSRVLRTCVFCKFLCEACNACPWSVIGPFTFSDILHNSPQCRTLCSEECFNISDHASTTFQLKIKEATTFNGRNLHLITNFIMLIKTFLVNAFNVLLLLFVLSHQYFVTYTLNSILYFALFRTEDDRTVETCF